MWPSIIDYLSSAQAPYAFCGFIAFVFVCALFDSWWRLSSVQLSVRRAISALDSATNPQAFYEQFETLGGRFSRERLFANPWQEFSKTVILDTERELVRITRRPQEFFNSASLIAPRINLRLSSAMPGYLISLGLFFTFIGLVAAIAIAAQGLGKGADITETQDALVQLLDVASLKFISSVAGIAFSIVLSFIQKSSLNRVLMRIHHYCSALELRTQLVTTEQLLHQWLIAQQQVVRGHSRLAEDIATEVTLQLNQVRA